jgi:methylmalonyl-CoA/ethylmalonyl-CoA epimerase
MIFHHIGVAVANIEESIDSFCQSFSDMKIESDIVYDPHQKVRLVLLACGGSMMELVEGETVSNMLKKGKTYYHICYEVENIKRTIDNLSGIVMVKPPLPAVLFNGREVAFVYHNILGLIELLESGQ